VSRQRQEILRLLAAAGTAGMSPAEVAVALGKKRRNVVQLMLTMRDAEQIERAADFRYRLP
jgi:DNA-binding IclR family transcriptional regulator